MRDRIVFFLNGQRREIPAEHAGTMLSDWLRRDAGLPGTKIVCAEGDCGACTVLRLFPVPGSRERADYLPINSCVTTLAQMDGSSLITVEGVGRPGSLSLVQQAMMECHGSQCGFCTPGFVMALAGLVEKKKRPEGKAAAGAPPDPRLLDAPLDEKEARNALTGNLCRCTGYEPILKAATRLVPARCPSLRDRHYSAAQEKALRAVQRQPLRLVTAEFAFAAPTTLREAARLLKKNRDARPIAGGTDLGVLHNKRKQRLHQLVSLHLVPEVYRIRASGKRITVGARVTLSELRRAVRERVPEFARFLDLFASPQIKNVATLVGNVGNASPIADTPPFLLVANAVVHAIGPRGRRKIPLEGFYLGYRKTALRAGEAIFAVEFDLPAKDESLALYKVSQRKDLDISTVNAAFRVKWDRGRQRIREARIAYGGVAATPLLLKRTPEALEGEATGSGLVSRAVETLHTEMTPIGDLRGSAAFRRVVAENLLRRFFREHGGVP